MTEAVEVTRSGAVALLTMNRPEQGNAFTSELSVALTSELRTIAADAAIHAVVITGKGRHFNVGGQRVTGDRASKPADWERSQDAHRQQFGNAVELMRLLYRMPKITIAAINGGCAGAGLALALATDLRYAATTAKLNTAFLSVGYPGELGAIWFATRLIGSGRARELFLRPDKVDAARAERIGLVNEIFESDELVPAVSRIAQEIATRPPAAVQAMKANLNDALTAGFDDYLDRETERMLATQWTAPVSSRQSPFAAGSAGN